ncbi:MAG: YraN family protein, partial [Ignavibacteriae bacterium]|nr:YraN family protein [Ignavibacteriota bacterium]
MDTNKQIGYSGQNYAKEFLRKEGLKFVEANYTIQGGELDLIFLDGNEYVFVEVKSRKQSTLTRESLISFSQKKSLINTAKIWLMKKGLYEVDWRIDLVLIVR